MPLRHRLNKECSREKFLKGGATDELGTLAAVSHKTYEHAAANVPEPVIDATRKKKLSINAAYDITRMDTEKQQEIAERISNGETPSNARVTYEQEKQLGEDPVRLDFLIIKKNNNDVTLNDPIGKFFRAVNIFEYKSPEDGLSIDDFYKAQGYGLIYKGYDRKVNELPIEEMTLTLVRHSYPRELMRTLKKTGFTNDTFHVLNEEGKAIENLFAVGECATARIFGDYYFEGFSLGFYTAARHIAGETAAKGTVEIIIFIKLVS